MTLFASPTGDDSADGSGWDTAKRTLLGAYDALPNSGGTIVLADNTHVGGEVKGQGFWIAGEHADPNWPRMSYNSGTYPGWRKAKTFLKIQQHLGTWPDTATAGQYAFERNVNLHLPKSYVDIAEITAPDAPAPGHVRLYVDKVGGKTRLMARFPTGAPRKVTVEL